MSPRAPTRPSTRTRSRTSRRISTASPYAFSPDDRRPAVCHAHDSEPPHLPADLALPRIAGAAAAEPLELQSADGGRFSAALAESPDPQGPAVVVLPDVRGLHPFYIRLAERFADAGHHAVAIDYFGRTAGLGPRDEAF